MKDSPATTDDLQGLLLQVVFALLMVFMIAFFIFVGDTRKAQAEQVLDLNRQKLVLALEKTAEDHRIRYGLNALLIQGTDGERHFEAADYVRDGNLALPSGVRAAFASGSAAALGDYADPAALAESWRGQVLAAAELTEADLPPEEEAWLQREMAERIESVRLDARGVQRALAAEIQRTFVEHPETLGASSDPGELADLLKKKSLERVRDSLGTEVLP